MRSRSRSPRLKDRESRRHDRREREKERDVTRDAHRSSRRGHRDVEHREREGARRDRHRERDFESAADRSRHRARDKEEHRERVREREKQERHRRSAERRFRDSRSRSPGPSKPSSDGETGGAVPKYLLDRPKICENDLQGKTEEEQEMLKLMGFAGFDTTKGKPVPGNDASAVNSLQKRKYRQYMNRKGGFNRLLDFVA